MKTYDSVLSWLDSQQSTALTTLIDWCQINSGSHNLSGLSGMRQQLMMAFSELTVRQQTIAVAPFTSINEQGLVTEHQVGDVLSFRARPTAPIQVLLCGHMDTVYGIDHPFQSCQRLTENKLQGPGVADMKGGLLVMLYALRGLEQLELGQQIGWEVLINADEELGSIASAPLLALKAQQYQLGLVFESSRGKAGLLAGERKGSGKLCLVVHGVAAHAGRSLQQGVNAIAALADAITAIHELNSQRSSVTVNVGRISGGGAVNVVADTAVVWLDVRVQLAVDQQWFMDKLNAIIKYTETKWHVRIDQHGDFYRPPKRLDEKTTALYHDLQRVGEQLALTIEWQDSGGCCDGNNLAAAGLPTIDSLGVRGDNIHSEQEFMYIDSLMERAKLSLLLLLDYAERKLNL